MSVVKGRGICCEPCTKCPDSPHIRSVRLATSVLRVLRLEQKKDPQSRQTTKSQGEFILKRVYHNQPEIIPF